MITAEKKMRSLVLLVVFLFITNIGLLFYLLLNKGNNNHNRDSGLSLVGSFLKDSIGFDKKQMELYQRWRKIDLERGRQAFEGIKSAKNKFYENIYVDKIADSVVNKLALVIGEKQVAVDKHMLQHFKNLRTICTPQQLQKFDSTFKTIVEKVTLGRVKKH